MTIGLAVRFREASQGPAYRWWVLAAYLATLTVTLLLAGRLADRWGRKPMTVVGVVLLTLGAAL